MGQNRKITLKRIAANIYPDWELEDWLYWPPNAFALISLLFQRTGSYKYCVAETGTNHWDNQDWPTKVNASAYKWLCFSNTLILDSTQKDLSDIECDLFKKTISTIRNHWDTIDVNDMRSTGDLHTGANSSDDQDNLKAFLSALIALFAMADCCCAGIGLVGQSHSRKKRKLRLFHGVANMLLNNTGSLSTIPKFHGVVLPKMRTPQSGLVLRSLSHNLTFHVSEVEVLWRSFPWLSNHKQSLNILAIPYPSNISKMDFRIVKDSYKPVRYFKCKVKALEDKNKQFVQSIVDEIQYGMESNNEVDIIVLPEMALSEKEYNLLLNKCYRMYTSVQNGHCLQLPIIVAGVIKEQPDALEYTCFHNEARIAIFFAGKWYHMVQRKHHRWNIDRSQILQYKLEGYFPTDRNWFELSSISQRRLSILAPNGWLALSALICEDLARQEPVGDLLRGIGPTLLMALLSDGPQLNNRWSARYASVLADDPGTSVLSLTSAGMVKRTYGADNPKISNPNVPAEKKDNITVGLWKDMITGWQEIKLNTLKPDQKDSNMNAVIFTISAKFKEEFTLDSRSDLSNASVFMMDTLNPKQIYLGERFKRDHPDKEEETVADEDSKYLGTWDDIRDLSAVYFIIDSIIDLFASDADANAVKCSIALLLQLLRPDPGKHEALDYLTQIKENISDSWQSPQKVGIDRNTEKHVEKSLADIKISIGEIKTIVDDFFTSQSSEKNLGCYDMLIDCCKKRLESLHGTSERVPKVIIMTFLFSINTKISNYKSKKGLQSDLETSNADALRIQDRIETILKEHLVNIKQKLPQDSSLATASLQPVR